MRRRGPSPDARTAIAGVGVQLVAIGVENLVEKLKKRKISKPRKAKAPKDAPATKAKAADPLTT